MDDGGAVGISPRLLAPSVRPSARSQTPKTPKLMGARAAAGQRLTSLVIRAFHARPQSCRTCHFSSASLAVTDVSSDVKWI